MRATISGLAFTVVTLVALGGNSEPIKRRGKCKKPLVQDKPLIDAIKANDLLGCAQTLQDIAYSSSGGKSRVVGTDGYDNTVKYWIDTLESLGDYYTIETQELTTEATLDERSDLVIDGETIAAGSFTYTNNGTWTDVELAAVANLGCDTTDFPDTLAGKVALIARGNCTFAEKVALAGEKGAVAALIYNNVIYGPAAGTLGGINDYIPVGGISQDLGLSYVEALDAGETIISSGDFSSYVGLATASNVVATSKYGDPNNVLLLGAHADSVASGPGINDNGSGSCALLTIAKALSHWRTNNQVKFAWWAAEEEGLVGAEHFTNATSAADLEKIRLYLNFDMIASPNYVFGIYDGDGSAFNLSGPAGSAEAEKLFEDYYTSNEIPFVPSEFNGRSDYGPFLDHEVPCGGLEAGADGIKTEEQVALFGGTAGIWYDPNYHSRLDTVDNLNLTAFETTSKAIAHAVATYGVSWEGFPTRNSTVTKKRSTEKNHEFHGHLKAL